MRDSALTPGALHVRLDDTSASFEDRCEQWFVATMTIVVHAAERT
jgi:hypothetical protein